MPTSVAAGSFRVRGSDTMAPAARELLREFYGIQKEETSDKLTNNKGRKQPAQVTDPLNIGESFNHKH